MKPILNPIYLDFKGKLGAVCFSHNHFGLYSKQYKTPKNPFSTYSQNIRLAFTQISKLWSQILQSERNEWIELASTIIKNPKYGDPFKYTGFTLFMKCNTNLWIIGKSPITAAPIINSIYRYRNINPSYDAINSRFIIDLIPGTAPANTFNTIAMTQNLSPGVNYAQNQYKYFGFVASPISTYYLNFSDFSTRFNSIPGTNQKYFFKSIPIDGNSGYSNLPIITNLLVP